MWQYAPQQYILIPHMTYSTVAIANTFIEYAKSGELRDLTPMKLQRLLFFAQRMSLSRHDVPLVDECFCRWPFGPVIPSLFHRLREYRHHPIPAFAWTHIQRGGETIRVRPAISDDDIDTRGIIEETIFQYGRYSGAQLAAISIATNSAWARTGPPDGRPIANVDLVQ